MADAGVRVAVSTVTMEDGRVAAIVTVGVGTRHEKVSVVDPPKREERTWR